MISYAFVYSATAKTALKVLSELLRVSAAPVDHLTETRDGFAASISIPGDPNSGAIYVYDRPTASMSILTVDERDSNFTAPEIANMFPAVVEHLNTPTAVPTTSRPAITNRQPERIQPQRHQQNRRNDRVRRQPGSNGGTPRPERVAAVAVVA
jgi:hypothetical protein